MAVLIALPASIGYGIADFAGGLAARRAPVLVVTAGAQAAGLLALLPLVGLVSGTPSGAAFLLGALGGIAGATGLLLYLRGLSIGPMGVIAPLSSVVGAGLPLVVGLAGGERPGVFALLAVCIALVAILLATAGSAKGSGARLGSLYGLAAGLGFGLFFVMMDATPPGSGLWPLLAGRITSTTVLVALLLAGRMSTDRATLRAALPLVALSGAVDTLSNVLFLIATRFGDLGVSAVLVSLYPVVVVLLARIVLKERLTGMQLTSAGLALGASVLLAATG
ncbi:DMT family transporter [Pseudonocardia sp. TRM90224]|uniref:DMT family transporter n=1 Tax=Pseudonocardia sp. TRM90224 TaxID=2812678 RepID=UPI001E493052|nr:DMT family transporter [Pseudonocardia sp. TRM90224]